MASRWYVLCCKPNKEQVLLRQLESRGYEIFYPWYYVENEKSGKLKLKPYFPGYLFVKVDLSVVGYSTFQWMPYTEGLVCFGLRPAYVPDRLVDAIRRHVEILNNDRMEKSTGREDNRVEAAELDSSLDEYGTIFEPDLTSDERVKGFLGLLQGVSFTPTASD